MDRNRKWFPWLCPVLALPSTTTQHLRAITNISLSFLCFCLALIWIEFLVSKITPQVKVFQYIEYSSYLCKNVQVQPHTEVTLSQSSRHLGQLTDFSEYVQNSLKVISDNPKPKATHSHGPRVSKGHSFQSVKSEVGGMVQRLSAQPK